MYHIYPIISWWTFRLFPVFVKKFLNVYLFERDRGSRGGAERGRHRIRSRLEASSCQHKAQHRARTHKLWNPDLSWSWTLNWATQAPHMSSFLLGIHLGVKLLDHMVILLNFWELSDCFPKWLHHFTFSLTMYEGSNFSSSSGTLVIFCTFDYSHHSGCDMLSHYLDLQVPRN